MGCLLQGAVPAFPPLLPSSCSLTQTSSAGTSRSELSLCLSMLSNLLTPQLHTIDRVGESSSAHRWNIDRFRLTRRSTVESNCIYYFCISNATSRKSVSDNFLWTSALTLEFIQL
ncbi:hypothetical protein GJAV_G00230480 [Gymnothorax javanicus]|nr:hypothetical protein GJAV_G00230480 [Gymnothorax javanicus]